MNLKKIFYLVLFLFFTGNSFSTQKYRNITYSQIKNEGKVWGIDLSHHQGEINWEKLVEQKPHFMFFKATEGTSITDTKYKSHYKNARTNNILVGSYHFFSYRSTGKAQAKHFLSVANVQKGDFPPVLDVEFKRKMPEKKKVTKEIIDFLKAVTAKTGYKPIIYCDYDYYLKYLKGNLKNEHNLWICDYRSKPDAKWLIWQTTDRFEIAGVSGKVDFNLFNGNKDKLNDVLIK